MRFCGVDEAALGPRLGPFCACLVEFDSSNDLSLTANLYEKLEDSITNDRGTDNRLVVADSKMIYTPARGIHLLEHSVRVFIELSGSVFPRNLHEFVGEFCPIDDYRQLQKTPWFHYADGDNLPMSNIDIGKVRQDADRVWQDMQRMKLVFKPPLLRFITAKTLNDLILTSKSKSEAVRIILSPLISQALRSSAKGRLSVDRQGGRRYYKCWLNEIPQDDLPIVRQEDRKVSVYEVGSFLIEFMVSADKIRLETALASMFAKYLREAAMLVFNSWWRQKHGSLRATAGYPQDANRFIKDLEEVNLLPENLDILIRRT